MRSKEIKKDQPIVKTEVIIKGMTITERFLDQVPQLKVVKEGRGEIPMGCEWPYLEDNIRKVQENMVGWCEYYPRGGTLYRRHVVLFLYNGVLFKADNYSNDSFYRYFSMKFPEKIIYVK